MTQAQQQALIAENSQLKRENAELIKEQKEFQDALKKQVKRISKLGPWKRFWGAVQLVKDLIMTIEAGFRG